MFGQQLVRPHNIAHIGKVALGRQIADNHVGGLAPLLDGHNLAGKIGHDKAEHLAGANVVKRPCFNHIQLKAGAVHLGQLAGR